MQLMYDCDSDFTRTFRALSSVDRDGSGIPDVSANAQLRDAPCDEGVIGAHVIVTSAVSWDDGSIDVPIVDRPPIRLRAGTP